MKKFLNIDDLRQLIKNIKSEFSKYSKKEDIPTKISQLDDDTFDNPVTRAMESNDAGYAIEAGKAHMDSNDNNIVNTYATKSELGDIRTDLYDVRTIASTAEYIAKGRATGYVFNTVEDMNAWLNKPDNTLNLVLGDNLYIRATDVPDYWWDGSAPQPLETQKVYLTEYATKAELGDIDKALDESIALCDSYLAWEVPV